MNRIMHEESLTLDPQLKYWVLLPISFVMVLIGLIRSNISLLLTPNPKLMPYKQLREKEFLRRAECFRHNNNILTAREFTMRKEYYLEKLQTSEFYAEEIEEDMGPKNPLADPNANDALVNMAKGSLMNYIPQTLIMGWVNYFFAGFVIMKLPFPLTASFKSMLQNGIATQDLDVRYVSAISWYFVNLLGLKPVYNLLTDDNTITDQLIMQQSAMPNISAPGAPRVDKIFKGEAESIQISNHESIFDGIVSRVLESNSYH